LTWPFIANAGLFGEQDPKEREAAGLRFADQTLLQPTDEQRTILMKVMPLIKERLHFLTEAPQMVRFLFEEPAVPPIEEIIPKKLDAEKTKAVLTKRCGERRSRWLKAR